MLTLYRYMVENGMKDISEVPEPYQSMLRAEQAPVEAPAEEQPAE